MKISDVITKHFDEFKSMVRNPDVVIENSNTSEDIFQSALLTAIKKYGDKDVDEIEAYEYTKKTILMEFLFCKKRIKKDMLVYMDYLSDLPDSTHPII